MLRTETDTPVPHRVILALACIPTADCILNQLTNGLHLYLGPVSLLQVLRTGLLLCFSGLILATILQHPERLRRVPLPAVGALLMLVLLLSKQWVTGGHIEAESIGAYGQMAYWLILWITASVVCVAPSQAMLLLYGLASGAVLTALSVCVGLASGGLNYYEDDLVHASSGWFNTAKMITGILVCGATVVLYLSSGRRRPWAYGLLAVFCMVSTILTYARAGTVALVLVVAWLCLWTVRANGFHQWRSLKWFLGLFLAAAIAAPLLIGPQNLFSRWGDVSEGEHAGSGRAAIWSIAADAYTTAPLPTQMLGRGYSAMSELLFREYGDDVKHTHNDALDMLLVGGVVGMGWLVSFIVAWSLRISSFSPWSLEGAAAVAIFVDYLCHAQFTGQLWGTDAMTYYVLALTSLTVIGCSRTAATRVRYAAPLTPAIANIQSRLDGGTQ